MLDASASFLEEVTSNTGSANSPLNFQNPQTIICFSHLRWNFVFQRPQHLMSRFARNHRVIYWEEPVLSDDRSAPALNLETCTTSGVTIATPHLPAELTSGERQAALCELLDDLLSNADDGVVGWYYTPMMRQFSKHINTVCVVYDCMDELSNFKFAPPELAALELELLAEADVVFTGGFSLYEAKRDHHRNIHPFPSSVDHAHFASARQCVPDPLDQAHLPHPRLGFYGVVDERMDLALLAGLADAQPDWSLIIIGPVVKIDPADLPQRPNLIYLGSKDYDDLPAYLAGWDVAIMPFAINDSTRFISPTKTPEYLAAGKPVVSTPIADVIRHYGALDGVRIADGLSAFIGACGEVLKLNGDWRIQADAALASSSWDDTQQKMQTLISSASRADTPPQSADPNGRWSGRLASF